MKKIKEVRFYTDECGNNVVGRWLSKLDNRDKARIHLRLVRLEYGVYGDCKNLGGKLFELRFFFAKGYRIYFTEKENRIIILLCAGDKDTQSKDIKTARSLAEEFRSR